MRTPTLVGARTHPTPPNSFAGKYLNDYGSGPAGGVMHIPPG